MTLIEQTRELLRKWLSMEKPTTFVHPNWQRWREDLRRYLLTEDFTNFLTNPLVRKVFYRLETNAATAWELDILTTAPEVQLLTTFTESPVGAPALVPGWPMSSNTVEMIYWQHLLRRFARWPRSIMEFGGGYGAFSYLLCKQMPNYHYTIIDLPEMLALQFYFLSSSLPGREICPITNQGNLVSENATVLVPLSLVDQMQVSTMDLFFSTFGLSETPDSMQTFILDQKFFGATNVFLAGQASNEYSTHQRFLDGICNQYAYSAIEEGHNTCSYELWASKEALCLEPQSPIECL